MATLLLRDLDDELVRLLEERARRHGRTVEAEHAAIPAEVLRAAEMVPAPSSGEALVASLLRLPRVELDWETGLDKTLKPAEFE